MYLASITFEISLDVTNITCISVCACVCLCACMHVRMWVYALAWELERIKIDTVDNG